MAHPNPVAPRKQRTLLAQLRRRVVGRSKPGDRLPTCLELAEKYNVSPMTVQRVFDRLAAEGFVVSRGKLGTFVVEQPPHLFRYGIVFTSDPSGGDNHHWPSAWHAFNQESLRVQHVDHRRSVVPFYNITNHRDTEDFQSLVRQVESSRLAGLLFATVAPPGAVVDSPVWDDPGLPRVMLQGTGVPGKAAGIDTCGWETVEMALDALAADGRKRIAIIDIPDSPSIDPNLVIPAIEKRGMKTRLCWLPEINQQTSFAANRITQLLMSGRPTERPDGLFISNPTLVEATTAGLQASGVRIPQELRVIASGNFPHLLRAHVPIRWLVVDIREVIRTAIELVDQQRRGEKPEQVTTLHNVFEEQIKLGDPFRQLLQA